MINRRPALRPMIITRSTFAGAGSKVGHWLGDNFSDWPHYVESIRTMLAFASLYQLPLVGSDVCGYNLDTTEQLCNRWAAIGAFSPFYRNHNNFPPQLSQEFYRWDSVAATARKVIDVRYRLLDYLYTAFRQQTVDGTPIASPLWFFYPQDKTTFPIDVQYFYGPGILVSPVLAENSSSVSIYLPNDRFYDFWTSEVIPDSEVGRFITIENLGWGDIPLHIRGGIILPMRIESTMTTTELRTKDFNIVVPLSKQGTAAGALYIDDGVSIEQPATTNINFNFDGKTFTMSGSYGFASGVSVTEVTFLGMNNVPKGVEVGGKVLSKNEFAFNNTAKTFIVKVSQPLTKDFSLVLQS